MKRVHSMPFGAWLLDEGGAEFRLWAPGARSVDLVRTAGPGTGAVRPMQHRGDGWFEIRVARADGATRYRYRIDGRLEVPDPASRWNPDDVHGASALIDPGAFTWPDADWCGRPWHEAVIYELHVGCFTPAGTYLAAVERLDDLVALGITAIELMPLAEFSGRRGWGYDGVLLYAPESAYGTPDELKQLVASAHARGLMVLLDVVYNHFGPDGNYLHAYAKAFFNPDAPTPWGAAINFDGAHSRTVRDFFIHNALYWIEEFHLDGLRLDAVHAMHDSSTPVFIDELARAVRDGPGRTRPVHLVLENDHNDAQRLARTGQGTPRWADAQWNDDLHHALHVLVTGEGDGYYLDYADAPVERFARTLAEGFGYQGEASAFRGGEGRGTPSTQLPPTAFVNSLQTHDQVGNRAFGERIAALAREAGRADALRAVLACSLLSPAIPMLFMGEEYAAATPFLYFCDYSGELAQAVTNGRRAEFGRFARFSDPALRERIPDPNAEATFRRSQLDWRERRLGEHAGWLALYTGLLHIRHAELRPWLAGARSGAWRRLGEATVCLRWPLGGGRAWNLLAQLSDGPGPSGVATSMPGRVVYCNVESAPSPGLRQAPRGGARKLGAARRFLESAPSPGFARPPEGVQENLGAARRFLEGLDTAPLPPWSVQVSVEEGA